MDPDACLWQLIDAVLDGDWDTARERLADLEEWANLEGFKIKDPR